MELTDLRQRLHSAVDSVIEEFLADQVALSDAGSGLEAVEPIGPIDPFSFRWPADYGTERFDSATVYRMAALGKDAAVILGWTTREAWNATRRRAVVFYRARSRDVPAKWYPCTEFVETDTGGFAATIPDPQRPRAILKDRSSLPARFSGKIVARADNLFDSIRHGASLRLVVDKDDEPEMVRHGRWVAQLRGRV